MKRDSLQNHSNHNFQHIVTTNFGIGIFDYEWLINRLEIFKLTTLTSLSNQSCTNFVWYVFVHRDIPESILGLLEECLKQKNNISSYIVKVPAYDMVHIAVNKIKNEIDADFLISSRIDDDDLVYENAVYDIQKEALKRKKEHAIIALVTGADYLPIDDIAIPRNSESIALMLSLVSVKQDNKILSINEFAHHLVVSTLANRGIDCEYIGIERTEPLYLYVKHPLSDSFYAGARARIINSPQKYSLNHDQFKRFGVDNKTREKLKSICSAVPHGMPYKYLEQLNSIRKKTLDKESKESNNAKFLYRKLSHKATKSRPWLAEKRKIRLAILGSNVSRDLFDVCPEINDTFEICFFNARTSLLSYVSPPCFNSKLKTPNKTFEDLCATLDINKRYWDELENSCPDMILIDFIDERIGSVRHDCTWITASGPIIKSFERENLDVEVIRPWSSIINHLRPWALKMFMNKILSITDNVVLHQASWSEKMLSDDGNKIDVDEKWHKLIELNNLILKKLFTLVDDNFPMVEKIGGIDIGMYAGGNHLWEFTPFNYDKSYYKSISKQLLYRAF
ncbi:MAG: DUF6270 domain-containing protein [Shewanella sp.]